jgi:hypothetical protein
MSGELYATCDSNTAAAASADSCELRCMEGKIR